MAAERRLAFMAQHEITGSIWLIAMANRSLRALRKLWVTCGVWGRCQTATCQTLTLVNFRRPINGGRFVTDSKEQIHTSVRRWATTTTSWPTQSHAGRVRCHGLVGPSHPPPGGPTGHRRIGKPPAGGPIPRAVRVVGRRTGDPLTERHHDAPVPRGESVRSTDGRANFLPARTRQLTR